MMIVADSSYLVQGLLKDAALIEMLGQTAGEAILALICKQAASALGLRDAIATVYSRKGDFSKFVASATTSTAHTPKQ